MRPTNGRVEPWLALGEHVVPDVGVRTHYLQYFAHLLQHPEIKINHGLLLISLIQGIGKDSWFAPVIRILGPLAVVITPDDLRNPFNDYLYEKVLLVVEELQDFGYDLPNKLKPILARPPDTLRINRKGVRQFDIPNLVHCFLMSNREHPLKIEASDRRFHIYQSPAEPKPTTFYREYYTWLDDGHLGDVFGFLLQHPLTDFNPYAPPPMTADKRVLIVASEPLLDQHLKEIIDDLPDLVTLAQIRDGLPARMRDTSPRRLAGSLKNLGAREIARIRLDGTRPHVWALRDHDQYVNLREDALKKKYVAGQYAMPPSTFTRIAKLDNQAG